MYRINFIHYYTISSPYSVGVLVPRWSTLRPTHRGCGLRWPDRGRRPWRRGHRHLLQGGLSAGITLAGRLRGRLRLRRGGRRNRIQRRVEMCRLSISVALARVLEVWNILAVRIVRPQLGAGRQRGHRATIEELGRGDGVNHYHVRRTINTCTYFVH